ncbi:MAG TPA: ATP synthase F1 subunit gamma [Verrucomicrobiae bacterium]|nr:ATP synthase F1 subunit gamma [Verrucomicrobiae bacterium]
MAVNSKEIKRRIKSVRNIGQITKAMELVSAAKMRKAQSLATSSRPYAILSSELLNNLATKIDITHHPLIHRHETEGKNKQGKTLIIVFTSDRGLAGAFNSNILGKAVSLLKNEGFQNVDFITVGRKGSDFVKKLDASLIAAFPAKDKSISIFDAKPIAQIAIEEYLNFTYDHVFVVYTDFISILVQKPNILKLLPIETHPEKTKEEFVFEPHPEKVLNHLVYRAIEFAVYQALVETSASEHSARMVAMRNANQASNDLIDELTLSANQARQAAITRELAEISAAKLAIEG